MEIPTYDFVWQQGEDGEINLVYRDSNGNPVDLTNYALRMDIRNDAGTQLFIFNSEDVTDPLDSAGDADNEAVLNSSGAIHIVVPRAVTLNSGALVDSIGSALKYDIFLRNKTTNRQGKILKGSILIEPSNTRWI